VAGLIGKRVDREYRKGRPALWDVLDHEFDVTPFGNVVRDCRPRLSGSS
jgi:hypothetical protein